MRRFALTVLATLVLAAPAGASVVRVQYQSVDDRADVYSRFSVVVEGRRGERNDVRARQVDRRTWVVEDRGTRGRIRVGKDCRRRTRVRVVCRGSSALDDVIVRLGDRDDRFHATGRWRVPGYVDGGAGDDSIRTDQAGLIGAGGAGDDLLVGATGADELSGGSGDDVLDGGSGNDRLAGGEGRDVLRGGAGDDELVAGDEERPRGDRFDGGPGADTVSYERRGTRVRVDLARGRGGSGGTEDRYRRIENATGGDRRDVLLGDDGPNVLDGGVGPDRVLGRGGPDELKGGVLSGGDGDDRLSPSVLVGSTCGAGSDVAFRMYALSRVPADCEGVELGSSYEALVVVPAHPVAVTEDALTFELACFLLFGCREWSLWLRWPTGAPNVQGATLARVGLPSFTGPTTFRVDVPRTPQLTGAVVVSLERDGSGVPLAAHQIDLP